MSKLRLDKLLVERGLALSRERAQALILAGKVLVNEQKIEKSGAAVEPDVVLRLLGEDLKYVSRGGLKLEKALDHWHIDVSRLVCVDVGASTGGFTDCLLQRGASRVIAIDTGYGQMDFRLRHDPRVRLLEKTNARYLSPQAIGEAASFVAMDVSFISATLVLPAVLSSAFPPPGALTAARGAVFKSDDGATGVPARPDASDNGATGVPARRNPNLQGSNRVIVLVKPQFEAGREQVGKGGIVRDEKAQLGAVERVRHSLAELGARNLEFIDSPILGAEGNREFLLYGEL